MSTELTTPIKIEIPGIGTIESADLYLKSEADKVIAEITEGAISMFRCSETCRGLDLKSPLGKIANIAFKHWNYVELIQNKNTQLQEDKEYLRQNNHHLLDEIERLKEKMERRERRHKYKRCLDKAERCRITAWFYGNAVSKVLNKDITDPDRQKVFRRLKHYKKWHLRWHELAENFKEAK